MKCLMALGQIWYIIILIGIFVLLSIRAVLEGRSNQKETRSDWDDEPAIVKFGEVLHLVLALLAVVAVVVYCLGSCKNTAGQ